MTEGYWILDGKKAVQVPDLETWARRMTPCRHIAEDLIGQARVSTVFLGIDCRAFGEGPPLIFESMVFGGALDGEQRRYSTWDEAEAGHKELVTAVSLRRNGSDDNE